MYIFVTTFCSSYKIVNSILKLELPILSKYAYNVLVLLFIRRFRNPFKRSKGSDDSPPSTIKYTAAKLHEKGVIIEIDELKPNQ